MPYLLQHERAENWPGLFTFCGMAASIIKPKSYTYKLVGLFCTPQLMTAFMAFHSMVLDHYSCRRRLQDVSLQKRFTVEEQEIRNLYEYFYPEDPQIASIAALSRECIEFRRIKQELNVHAH